MTGVLLHGCYWVDSSSLVDYNLSDLNDICQHMPW